MSGLGPDAREILRNGRDGDNPSPADRARIRAALMATIATSAAATASSAANAAAEVGLPASVGATKPFIGSIWGGLFGKGMLVVFLGAAGAGALAAWPKTDSRPTAITPHIPEKPVSTNIVTPAPLPPAVSEEASAEKINDPKTMAPLPPEQPKTSSIRPSNAPSSPKAPEVPEESADTLIAETQRLRQAHGAMRGGDPEKALALLSEQSAENEGQKLRAERAAARVLALCKLGRVDEAHAEAEAFLAQNPQSPLADRVRKACPPTP